MPAEMAAHPALASPTLLINFPNEEASFCEQKYSRMAPVTEQGEKPSPSQPWHLGAALLVGKLRHEAFPHGSCGGGAPHTLIHFLGCAFLGRS